MLRKLALGGIRSRFRDYAVLFSGLVIASAVFYMFMALATNTKFLTSNSPIGMTPFIFGFGEVLLVIITMVYIVYANTFLMSMRQRDYAMFMMLGAKSRKIAQLIFIETVSVGFLASVVGVVIGMGLTGIAGNMLISMLHAPASHFAVVWPPALIATFGFFLLMFVLAAFVNAGRLLKTPMLELLHASTLPNRLQQKRWKLIVQGILAIVLLAIGYWSMTQLAKLQMAAIGIALITIVLGTYFLFNALLVWLIGLLKKNHAYAAKSLHTFTLSQLSFRIRDYTKILAVVAILFALALGAITVGLGFQNAIPELANTQSAYDATTIDANAATQKAAAELTGVTSKTRYTQKVTSKAVVFDQTQINARPLKFIAYDGKTSTHLSLKTNADLTKNMNEIASQLEQFRTPADAQRQIKIVPHAEYVALTGKTRNIVTYQVKDFAANYDAFDAMFKAQNKQFHVTNTQMSGQKMATYGLINEMFSGLAFMGFFLGIAFLAMLASTLMFKILSGASFDASRYLMLQKIGVRPGLLRRSVRQEIGALFAFPGVFGVIHVLFGLQLFTSMLHDPYHNIWIPFAIFIVLYGVYYALTVWLYEGIVIKKDLAK